MDEQQNSNNKLLQLKSLKYILAVIGASIAFYALYSENYLLFGITNLPLWTFLCAGSQGCHNIPLENYPELVLYTILGAVLYYLIGLFIEGIKTKKVLMSTILIFVLITLTLTGIYSIIRGLSNLGP